MEIGYYAIQPTSVGSPYFENDLHVYQWHKEGFDLPRDCTLLATGDNFPNQAFRYGENAFGIQFHPEVTEAMNRKWLNKAAHMLIEPGAQAANDQLAARMRHDHGMRHWLDNFLSNWIGAAPKTAPPISLAMPLTRHSAIGIR